MSEITIEKMTIELTRKNIKNLHLKVTPPHGHIKISAPKKMSERQIRSFIISKLDWIKTHQQKILARPYPKPLQYIDGETIKYQGIPYQLQFKEHSKPGKVECLQNIILLYHRPGSTILQKEKILNDWYRNQLRIRIPELICHYEAIMNVIVADFGIKRMKTKWGTCNITARRIWLNLELAKKSPKCLTYIVVHEMTHLLETGHTKRFYALLDQFMPDWKSAEQELNPR